MKKVLKLNDTGKPTGRVEIHFDDSLPPIVFDTSRISSTVREYAVPFAFMHRLGDAAAIASSDAKGNVVKVTDAMRREKINELVEHYYSGSDDWNLKTRAKAVKAENAAVRAYADKLGVDYDEALAKMAERMLAELGA